MSTIGKINLDFQVVDSGDPKALIVADFSQWRVIEDLPAFVEITMPGSSKPIIHSWKKHALNGFNSVTLEISCHKDCEENYEDLPDGIYGICLKGSPEGKYMFHRYYLKKDKFQLEFDKLWVKLGIDYHKKDKEFRDCLLTIHALLQASCASTRRGEIAVAHRTFKDAQKLLEKHAECKNCL